MEKIGFFTSQTGVVEKCTFCVDLVAQGKEPACVKTCIGKARLFRRPLMTDSKVSQLIKSVTVRSIKGTGDRSFGYLPPIIKDLNIDLINSH